MSTLRAIADAVADAGEAARRRLDGVSAHLDQALRQVASPLDRPLAGLPAIGDSMTRRLRALSDEVVDRIRREADDLRELIGDADGGDSPDVHVATPRGFHAVEAQSYEATRGHGFTLPGERAAWLSDVGAVLRAVAAELPAEPVVLDIGCGTGKFTRLIRDVLEEQFARAPVVHGVDASNDMLAVARGLDTRRIEYRTGDARRLGGRRDYDLVVSCQVLDSFEDPAALLADWRQALLKPGGHVLTALAFSRPEGWTNRTPAELERMPLARVTSIEPLRDATVRAGYDDVRAGFLPTVSPLYGGASTGAVGPVGSRYYAIATAPADEPPRDTD